jgi:hypothetical protein
MEDQTAAALDLSHPDPEIADALRAAASTERLLGEALLRLGPNHLRGVPPGYDMWSAVETLGHLLDAEIVFGHHLRLIISQDSPRLEPFDEEAFVIAQRWRVSELPTLFSAWSGLRRAHLTLIARLDVNILARGGVHSAEGPVTAHDLVLNLSTHDRLYLSRLGQLEERVLRPLG